MSPQNFTVAWSFKNELKIVAFSFLLILLMPVIAVILLTQTGINIISDKLASVNEITKKVEIHDPTTGEVIKTLDTKTTWPTNGIITLEFGEVDLPYQPLHTGIDIAGKKDDPVTAFMTGKVLYAGEISWGYGKHIIIENGNNITSLYGHLDKILVAPGQEIKTTTQVIGLQGQTGWATGVHTHFEIRVFGIPVNPRTFLEGNPL